MGGYNLPLSLITLISFNIFFLFIHATGAFYGRTEKNKEKLFFRLLSLLECLSCSGSAKRKTERKKSLAD
jgi:hypothetical protein